MIQRMLGWAFTAGRRITVLVKRTVGFSETANTNIEAIFFNLLFLSELLSLLLFCSG